MMLMRRRGNTCRGDELPLLAEVGVSCSNPRPRYGDAMLTSMKLHPHHVENEEHFKQLRADPAIHT